jgi:hypothetical protein
VELLTGEPRKATESRKPESAALWGPVLVARALSGGVRVCFKLLEGGRKREQGLSLGERAFVLVAHRRICPKKRTCSRPVVRDGLYPGSARGRD